jgi:hypothetical protein
MTAEGTVGAPTCLYWTDGKVVTEGLKSTCYRTIRAKPDHYTTTGTTKSLLLV